MPQISKIKLPSGTVYDLKDATARAQIEAITGGDAIVFMGVSTTEITDGGNQQPTISGSAKTPGTGWLVFYGTEEFIYGPDSKWHALGSLDSLGDLAYKDEATGTYTPSGTVSQPTFTGSSSAVTITATNNNSGNYQPAGSITGGAFTGSNTTFSGKFTPAGGVTTTTATTSNKTATVSTTTGTATYTPGGTVSQPTFSGSSLTSSGDFTPAGTVTLTKTNKTATVSVADSGTATYTPGGSVAAPTISVATAGSTATVKNPTSVTVAKTVVAAAPGATAPDNSLTYYAVADETLSLYQLGYTTGDSITTSNVTVKTGDASYSASAPAFTGTGVRLVTGNISTADSASFSGTQATVSVSGTPSGTISQPTFTGTGVRLITGNIPVPATYTSTFSGTEGDVSTSGTPNGSNGALTFTGTKVQLAGTTTATGTISQPEFTGTQGTVTVS